MSYRDNANLLRKGYEAMAAGDAATVIGMFADDGVLHVSGDGPLAGDHKGHEAIGQTLAGLFEWTGGTIRMEVEDVFADDEHGVALVKETATRAQDGLSLDVRESHLVRFANGRVTDLWDLPAPADKEAHDAFFS